MNERQLRRADFLTSIIIIGFAVWMFFQGLDMPMKGTYAGVESQWYVAPALLPIVISILLVLLGSALLAHSIRTGGARALKEALARGKATIQEPQIRMAAVVLAFIVYVFLNIPRVDYFIATATFLLFFIGAFQPNSDDLLRRVTLFFAAEQMLLLLVFVTGLGEVLNTALIYRMVPYGTDLVALILLVALWIYLTVITRHSAQMKKARRIAVLVALIMPLVLTPVFRYALRVRLPHEGAIVELFHLVYYSIR